MNACRFLNSYALKWYKPRHFKKIFWGSNFVQKYGPSYKSGVIAKKWAGFSISDFSLDFGPSHKYVWFGTLKCSNDATKSTKSVSVLCKFKNGKEGWKFKGNPTAEPHKGCYHRRLLDGMLKEMGRESFWPGIFQNSRRIRH